MKEDFELYKGKSFSSLLEDIYKNQSNKKRKLNDLLEDVTKMMKSPADVVTIGPIVRDLIDTSVKNDEHLIKMANIVQKVISTEKRTESVDGILTDEEKQQLLSMRTEFDNEISDLEDTISDIKK